MLQLRNPHSVMAAMRHRPTAVRSISVAPKNRTPAWGDVIRAAERQGIPVSDRVPTDRSGSRRRDTERVGAGTAMVEPPSPVPLQNLLRSADAGSPAESDTAAEFGLWLALDQVQDPQNLGALFRLAGFFGVRGIVMTKDRTSPVNATVCDVAAGGVESVPFTVVANLAQAMDRAKEAGVWTLGTCERSDESFFGLNRDRHWMLVFGNEGSGMRQLTRKKCDVVAAIPPLGEVDSLNVSTAAACCLTVLCRSAAG